MITIDVVDKIIKDNNNSVKEEYVNFGYGPNRIELLEYINSLKMDEQLFLMAMVDYGREKYNMKDNTVDKDLFYNKLAEIQNIHLENNHISNYLLGKGGKLSDYLLMARNILLK